MPQIRVGMSGWTHEGWRDDFYPKGLPQKRELEYASRKVNSIEVNGTFYGLLKPESFQSWYEQVPSDFVFAIKGGQYLTHVRRLKEVEEPLANFFASGLLCLGKKLGPILWQFPPNVMLKDNRFEKFLKLLPHTSAEAAELAAQHTDKMEGRAWTTALGPHPVRHAFEFRHKSFNNPDFLAMLTAHNVAAVITHASGNSAGIEDLTADFAYVRLHGEDAKFKKGYTPDVIREWTKKVEGWSKTRDVFAYFGTDAKEYAPFDAMNLMKALKLKASTEPLSFAAKPVRKKAKAA